MRIKLNINNQEMHVDVRPDEYLLETLRQNHFKSVKKAPR